MLLKKVAFFILIGGSLTIAAQPSVKWSKHISGKGEQWVSDVVADPSGNIYVAGEFDDICHFDNHLLKIDITNTSGLFVAKYDAMGKLLWVKQLCGEGEPEASKLVLDPFGNIYLSGSFSPTLFVPDNPSIDAISCRKGKDNTFICKLTTEGRVLWLKHFESQYHNDPSELAVDSKGNVICVGRFETMMDLDPGKGVKICKLSEYEQSYEWPFADAFEAFIVKLDTSGNLVWSHHLASTGDCYIRGILVDENDQVYCTGTFRGKLFIYDESDLPGLPSNSSGSSFFIKTDPSGKIVFNRNLAVDDEDLWACEMIMDGAGNIYIEGIFRGEATFSRQISEGYINSKGDIDFFLCCINKKGEVQWVKQYGNEGADHCHDFCLDDQSNIYISGTYYEELDFDPGPHQHIEQADSGENLFVLKLDKTGNFQWVYTAGGKGDGQIWGYSVCWSKISGLCMSGFFRREVLELGGKHNLVNAGGADAFIAILGSSPEPSPQNK